MTSVSKQRTNGDQEAAGQALPVTSVFTFRDTGISVRVRKVSNVLRREVERAFPPPKPVLQEVDYGDGKKAMEPNTSHPDYEAALIAWRRELDKRLWKLVIKRGVEVDADAIAGPVAQVRADAAEAGITLDPDDKFVYITCIAIGTDEDESELISYIYRRSQPTEAAIAEALEGFPGQVPGA